MNFSPEDEPDPIVAQSVQTLDRKPLDAEARRSYAALLAAYRANCLALNRLSAELYQRTIEAECVRGKLERVEGNLSRIENSLSLNGLIAGVAHEINTPLGVTLTAASHLADQTEVLCRNFQQGRIRRVDFEEFVQMVGEASRLILVNSQHAAELIQGFKQVAVDQTTAQRRRFQVKAYLDDVLLSLRPLLRRSGHQICVECPDDLEIDGYPGALSQIITNFVTNAIQHGYEPGRAGRLSIVLRRCDPDRLELVFADDGRGIPEENRRRIFDPFFTTRGAEGGTGLGLHIVASIVARTLRGTLRVDSEVGAGTRFVVNFPLAIAADDPKPAVELAEVDRP